MAAGLSTNELVARPTRGRGAFSRHAAARESAACRRKCPPVPDRQEIWPHTGGPSHPVALGKACRRGKMGECEGVNLITACLTSLSPSSPISRHIAVVGGGIAGLAAAHRLAELAPQFGVTLFEAGPRLGGVLSTVHRDGFQVEQSADNFITTIPWGVESMPAAGLGRSAGARPIRATGGPTWSAAAGCIGCRTGS